MKSEPGSLEPGTLQFTSDQIHAAEQASAEGAYPQDAWDLLSDRLTPPRRERLLAASLQRTRHLRLIIQDVHQPHNVSACLRSAEAFGIQDVDIVTLGRKFRASNASRGVATWLTVRRHKSVPDCVTELRAAGYAIAAGVPRPEAQSLYELPIEQKIAIVFGNEHDGIDPEWLPHVDLPFTIPMVGLVESMNISVCAAITLAHLSQKARISLPASTYLLNPQQHKNLLCTWICRQIPHWEAELKYIRLQTTKP